jgi:phosphatidylserine/phosphatidylglycerophosphate/cardiolipin synthase-like enzyme
VHAKLIVADDTALFGTVNLDAWALYRNYEVAMMARDAKTAGLLEERVFEPDIAKAYPAKPDTSVGARLRDWFWNELAYFL